jgi:phosphate-selective porin OprO/OprP
LLALDYAEQRGPWSVQAEAFFNALHAPALGNPLLKGFYVSVSHMLTGEHRRYDKSIGVFDGVIPARNFSWADRTWGALEVVLRLSTLDLNDKGLAGGRQRDISAGFNWYLSPDTRVMVNWVHALVNSRVTAPQVTGARANIVQARLQLAF